MKILLNGYFHANLGDDLFFHLITDRYPQHKFYMPVHADHAYAYVGKDNVKLFRQPKLLRGLNKILCAISPKLGLTALAEKTTDLSVLIGGSMFQELDSDGTSLKRISQMPHHKKGLYILGINFGPFKTQGYLQYCRKYLSHATDVCFRDSVSYNYFSDLPHTRLGSDIVFGIEKICPAATSKANTCVISVMDFEAKPDLAPYAQDYYRFLVDMALRQQALGRKVQLVSFCDWEGDKRAIEQFFLHCPQQAQQNICTLCYDGRNWKEVCQAISSAECVIASRFHSMVLGLAYGVPTIAISYSNKTAQLLANIGAQDFIITPDRLKDICAEDLIPIQGLDIHLCKAGAEDQFKELDRLLNT